MSFLDRYRTPVLSAAAVVLLFIVAGSASAAGATGGAGAMPWEGPLNAIADSLSGPVARAVAIIAIVGFGVTLALGLGGGAMRTVLGIGAGLSITAAAVSWGLPLFGFGMTL